VGLDWSTFVLELINFLILVWILKRFLYTPVKAAIEQRRQRVEAALAEADARRAEAEKMRADYESRQQGWERERAEAQAALKREIHVERARRLDEIEQEIARRSEKALVLEEGKRREAEQREQETALALAAGFSAKLLTRLADPALEARLVELALEDLPTLTDEQRHALAESLEDGQFVARVLSAFALNKEQRRSIENALSEAVGMPVHCDFAQEPALVAGVRIDTGPLVMRANLRDELRFFAESAR